MQIVTVICKINSYIADLLQNLEKKFHLYKVHTTSTIIEIIFLYFFYLGDEKKGFFIQVKNILMTYKEISGIQNIPKGFIKCGLS